VIRPGRRRSLSGLGRCASGSRTLVVWDSQDTYGAITPLGVGEEPVWKPDGSAILVRIPGPNQEALTAYRFPDGVQILSYTPLPSRLHGSIWLNGQRQNCCRQHIPLNILALLYQLSGLHA
jgi:hypothetical protein